MSSGAEVTRLGATDLGTEVTGRAQKKILRGWYIGARKHGAELGATDLGAELQPLAWCVRRGDQAFTTAVHYAVLAGQYSGSGQPQIHLEGNKKKKEVAVVFCFPPRRTTHASWF